MKELRKRLKNHPPLTAEQQKQLQNIWGDFPHFDLTCAEIRYLSATSGTFCADYVPSQLFHRVLWPILNPPLFAHSLHDKNYLDLQLGEVPTVYNIVRNVCGHFYDHDFRLISEREAADLLRQYPVVVIKPSLNSHNGIGVRRLESAATDFAEIFRTYGGNFVFQVPVKQSPFMAQLNESSLNTFRVVTCFIGDCPKVCCAFVKVGAPGAFVDNAGGERRFIGICGNRFQPFALTHGGRKCDAVPSGFDFRNAEIPQMDAVYATALAAHRHFPQCKIVFWDICLNEQDKPVVVEANLRHPVLRIPQQANGQSFFGDCTAEILDFVRREARNYDPMTEQGIF